MEAGSFFDRLVTLGQFLKDDCYSFITPTPLTHARILARGQDGPDILRDIFGWNKPFIVDRLPVRYRTFLEDAAILSRHESGKYCARVRFSNLGPLLLAHSSYPTKQTDAVFFGPDTYRFAHAIQDLRDREPGFMPRTCVDIGAGSGAGGLFCASRFPSLRDIALLDINPRALAFARANITLNAVAAAYACQSDILAGWRRSAELIVSNPPYLVDPAARAYRHGGGDWGTTLSVRILEEALTQLSSTGHLLLYTGSAIVDGQDKFLDAARGLLEKRTFKYRYAEIDPDVFGEELDNPPYNQADRIATVLLHVKATDVKR